MAGKIKPMSQIKQLLLLQQQGQKIKAIARNLGISKNTVKSYVARIIVMNKPIEELLAMDDPSLASIFHGGNPAYKDTRYEFMKSRFDYYVAELKRKGVTQKLLWEEYISEAPDGYGLTQFTFHLRQLLNARKPAMVLTHEPAQKLFVDFAGHKLSYIDKETGECIECPVFVACLPFSDYAFAMAVRSQCIEEFIHALTQCIEFLGGAPAILVPDNLKAAVIKANRYEPELNRALEDFCNHYGITIIPTRVASPKDKALVENQVKLIYTRVFAKNRNRQFFDLTSLNLAVRESIMLHNQTRMQKKPYCREERFLATEKARLLPLPDQSYEIKYYRELKVAKNNHVYLSIDKHYYSVPFQWIGRSVKAIYTRSVVRIYLHGEMIAMHPRRYVAGGYSTIVEHLCSHHQHYLSRSPAWYMEKASRISEHLLTIIKGLFDGGRPAEQNYRSCDGFLKLSRITDPRIFEAACKYAIEDRCFSYRYLMNTISRLQKVGLTASTQEKPLPAHANIRGKEYYRQISINL